MQLLVQNCPDPSRATEIFFVPKQRFFLYQKMYATEIKADHSSFLPQWSTCACMCMTKSSLPLALLQLTITSCNHLAKNIKNENKTHEWATQRTKATDPKSCPDVRCNKATRLVAKRVHEITQISCILLLTEVKLLWIICCQRKKKEKENGENS